MFFSTHSIKKKKKLLIIWILSRENITSCLRIRKQHFGVEPGSSACRRGHVRPSQSLSSARKILPVLLAWRRRVLDGDFLHLTLCLASCLLPSSIPSQPHTCSLLVSHSTFFTLSPPHTPSLTRYLSADLLSPSHWAFAPCSFFFFLFFSLQALR